METTSWSTCEAPCIYWGLTFPSGVYDYDDINKFIQSKLGPLTSGGSTYGVNILFNLTTYKVYIKLENNYWIDFNNSGNFGDLLGFHKTKILKASAYASTFPNIVLSNIVLTICI